MTPHATAWCALPEPSVLSCIDELATGGRTRERTPIVQSAKLKPLPAFAPEPAPARPKPPLAPCYTATRTQLATLRRCSASLVTRQIPFRVLRFLFTEINYGGRVTDAQDRRLMDALAGTFCGPQARGAARAAPGPGTGQPARGRRRPPSAGTRVPCSTPARVQRGRGAAAPGFPSPICFQVESDSELPRIWIICDIVHPPVPPRCWRRATLSHPALRSPRRAARL